MQPRQQAILKQ